MVNDAIERLREAGVKRAELTVESDNPRAIAFCRRMGFDVEGALRKFYKRVGEAHYVDDYVMARLLISGFTPFRKFHFTEQRIKTRS